MRRRRIRPSTPTMLDVYVPKLLSMKRFHGVRAGNAHARSLTSSIGKASSLVCLEVAPEEVAIFVRRVLRHPRLNTQAKRLGTVVRASHRGLGVWRLHAQEEEVMLWGTPGG
jgi:hypothetical protein